MLRSYAAYLHQAGTPYSRSYVASCLVAHASLAGRLVELFEARFDPALGAADSPSRTQRMTKLTDGALRVWTRSPHWTRTASCAAS